MGYRIEGDGTHQHTQIWCDGELVEKWHDCNIVIDEDGCRANVNAEECKDCHDWQPITRLILTGIYIVVSEGQFSNSKVFINEEMLRGVQSLIIDITEGEHPMMRIVTVLLPNIVEAEE